MVRYVIITVGLLVVVYMCAVAISVIALLCIIVCRDLRTLWRSWWL